MIDFTLSEAHQNIRAMIHWFGENEIRPISLQADRDHKCPEALVKKLGVMGMQSGGMPETMGGKEGEGLGEERDRRGKKQINRLSAMGSEEIAWADPAIVLNIPGPGLGAPPVRFMGTKDQQERFFSVFRDADNPKFGAYGLTEPGAGSDAAAISTTAVKDGNHYVLNGTKCFISNGARAEWVVIFATIDKSKGRAGHRVFVVEKGTPGFRVGRIEEKMGMHATETAELVLEDCRVHQDNLLGGEALYNRNEGFLGAMKTFDLTRPMVASMAVGIARASFERARDFVKTNYTLSRPIARYRVIADRLAEIARNIEAARLMVWRAAWMADEGIPNTKEASMSKAYAGQLATKACIDAIQVMGADGLRRDQLVEKWFRDIKVYDIFEGTGQAQRIVISKRILQNLKSF